MELDTLGVRLDLADEPVLAGARDQERRTRSARSRGAARARRRGWRRGSTRCAPCRIGRDGWLRAERPAASRPRTCAPPSTPRIMADGLRARAHHLRARRPGRGPARGGPRSDPRALTPVVMDIFPRSERTGYFGDLTRTVVRGRAIRAAQGGLRARRTRACAWATRRIQRRGRRAGHPSRRSRSLFDARGLSAPACKHGRMQGFFHGTGHGLGLQIHEPPSISTRHVDAARRARGDRASLASTTWAWAVRIEDVALVTADRVPQPDPRPQVPGALTGGPVRHVLAMPAPWPAVFVDSWLLAAGARPARGPESAVRDPRARCRARLTAMAGSLRAGGHRRGPSRALPANERQCPGPAGGGRADRGPAVPAPGLGGQRGAAARRSPPDDTRRSAARASATS